MSVGSAWDSPTMRLRTVEDQPDRHPQKTWMGMELLEQIVLVGLREFAHRGGGEHDARRPARDPLCLFQADGAPEIPRRQMAGPGAAQRLHAHLLWNAATQGVHDTLSQLEAALNLKAGFG